jgi:multiple sugar transport system ATP-binding protein
MNFLPATALEGGTRVRLASGEELTMPFTAQTTPGQKLLVGLRPEFGRLAVAGEGVLLDVLVIEPTGADTTLICRAGATEVAIVLRDRTTLKVGERVMWQPTLAKAHLFDEQSGQRVADARQAD